MHSHNISNQHNRAQLYATIVLFVVVVIDTMGVALAHPVFSYLLTSKAATFFTGVVSMKWRNFLCGFVISITNLFMFLAAPIVGNISDRIGRRKTLFFCLIGSAASMGLTVISINFHSAPLLIISRALLGCVTASLIIAKAAVIDISNKSNKAYLIGVIMVASNIGFIFGPILGSLLMDNTLISWCRVTTPFYFSAILAIINSFFLLIAYKEEVKKNITSNFCFVNNIKTFAKAFANKEIKFLSITYCCFEIGWAIYCQTNFLFLVQKCNYSGRFLGYFSIWMGVIFCISLLAIRIITNLVDFKKIICATLLIEILCCVIISSVGFNERSIWAILLPMVSAISLSENALTTTFSNFAEKQEQGWIMGIRKGLAAMSWFIALPIAGFIFSFGIHIPLFFSGSCFLICLIITTLKLKI